MTGDSIIRRLSFFLEHTENVPRPLTNLKLHVTRFRLPPEHYRILIEFLKQVEPMPEPRAKIKFICVGGDREISVAIDESISVMKADVAFERELHL